MEYILMKYIGRNNMGPNTLPCGTKVGPVPSCYIFRWYILVGDVQLTSFWFICLQHIECFVYWLLPIDFHAVLVKCFLKIQIHKINCFVVVRVIYVYMWLWQRNRAGLWGSYLCFFSSMMLVWVVVVVLGRPLGPFVVVVVVVVVVRAVRTDY